MRKNFQLLLVLSLMAVFQIGFWSFTFLSHRYIKNELINQVLEDNHVVGKQMVTLLQKTGLTDTNPETDSLLQDICDMVKLPNGGFICAINSKGYLVAAPGLNPGMSMPFEPMLSSIKNKKKGIIPSSLNSDTIFSGYAYFKEDKRLDVVASMPIGADLRLFVHQNSGLIQKKAWKAVKPLILFGFLVTFFVGVFAWLATKKIVEGYENKIENQNAELRVAIGQINEKQLEIVQKNSELEIHRNELININHLISEKSKEVNDSINYAQRIQKAALPKSSITNPIIKDYFILFMPKDVVSGDFYWYHNFDDIFVVTVVDCTGHGVPGAFMSMMGITFLNEIVIEKRIKDPGIILEYMRRNVINALGQEFGKNTSLDGMNMALCIIDKAKYTMDFAGAYNPVVIMRGDEMIKIEGDKMPVGIHAKMDDEFRNNSVKLQADDSIYLFSDGFADQFGGKSGRKFMSKNFNSLIYEIKDQQMADQKNILEQTFVQWKGTHDQVDDVLVIGLKIK